jgi:dihydroorotate dehydrogenase electron transfer subunit
MTPALREVTVAGSEPCGAYALVRLDGDVDVGAPGQFAMVRDPDGQAFLPRPVGLFLLGEESPAMLVDPAFGVGALQRARRLNVLGPLGIGFDLAGARPETTLLVAGGIGITVFPGVPAALRGRPRLVAGFRLADQAAAIALVDADAEIVLAPRVVTDVLDLAGVERVLACGPTPMVHAVAAACAAAGVPCQVGLEAPMACGFGACYGCVVRLDGAWKRLCIEGPVVAAERLSA